MAGTIPENKQATATPDFTIHEGIVTAEDRAQVCIRQTDYQEFVDKGICWICQDRQAVMGFDTCMTCFDKE